MENHDLIKEKILLDLKSVKNSLDYNLKVVTEHQENLEKRLKEFCYNVNQNTEKTLKEEIGEYERKMHDIKMENGKYHLEAMKLVKEI